MDKPIRRWLLVGVFGGLAALGTAYLVLDGRSQFYAAITEDFAGETLSAPEAYRMATEGEITMIDIRRPDEWVKTGSPAGAARMDLRRDDFIAALSETVNGNRDAPIALICARGVRSARLGNLLRDAGFTRIIDVPEGMLGSAAGPGWLARDLPVDRS
ncbi:rhodanese-like domain-containing protein [Oceaniovalibus sp. ACAM 378]|uniref:rhodanese-like domain-containing protein n=1 Tax=Oceaniovalibus sp. ACAM 378 TaxID=2599923 RepID=UPI0011DAF0FE|nr:rhodanese-like domain-containing protein [Oceaniovalibus sp. ACAM 378]TYB87698.1 rhodanese-like domain-containing protein [Oceaniovalibus sp. ACAM 378]